MKRLQLLPLIAVVLLAGCSGDTRSARPNILLITLDTTRSDHLGVYGYDRPTSPNLDRLAAEAVVYEHCYAVSSWTMPTHASLFTGKYPSAHGAQYNDQGVMNLGEGLGGQFAHYRANPISQSEITLAQQLKKAGYVTGGATAGPWMKKPFRLDRGFDSYDDEGITALNGRPAEDVTRVAKEFIDEHAGRPFFLFLNYYDPHGPLLPQPDFLPLVIPPGTKPPKDRDGQDRILYDAEIRYMDHWLGKLFDHLREKGLYDDTWILITADHGELMGDPILGGGALYGHGNSLSEAELRVPLIVKYPRADARQGRETRPVQQVDILPTIHERLGIALPPNVQGQSLDSEDERVIFAEVYPLQAMGTMNDSREWRHHGDWRVLITENYKLGWNSLGNHFLVDLQADPNERENIAATQPERMTRSLQVLERFVAGFPKPGEIGEVEDISGELQDALRSLGYMGEDEHAPKEPEQDEQGSGR